MPSQDKPVQTSERGRRQIVRGVVVSDKMEKTRIITIKRTYRHSLYHKKLNRSSRIFVHDEKNESKTGDTVLAVASRPLSKLKSFRLVKIVEKRVQE